MFAIDIFYKRVNTFARGQVGCSMKVYELRFLDARGATVLAYVDAFAGEAEAAKMLASLRAISCDRAELWCDEQLIVQERHAATVRSDEAA